MNTVRLKTCSLQSTATLKAPILSWTDVPTRFFKAIHHALGERLFIQPGDLVRTDGNSLGDYSVSLRIFGGNNSFTLAADRMIATFTNVPVHQTDFVNSIILQAYQACLDEFVEIEISSIRSDANYHFEMTGKVSASDILKVDKSNKLIERARSVSSIVVEPAIRFQIVDKDGRWNCKVTSEKSELVDAGLFLERIILVNDLTDIEAPVKQFELISRIEKMIEEFLKLTLVEESTHEN